MGLLGGCREASVGTAETRKQSASRAVIRGELVSAQTLQSTASVAGDLDSSNEALIAYLAVINNRSERKPELNSWIADLRSNYLKLLDPVWGGVYLSVNRSVRQGDPEVQLDARKRLSAQAAALKVFAAAYQATAEPRYANALASVDEYLQEWLAVSDGSYFAGQLTQPENLPSHIPVQRYWSLRTEHERRRFGIPGVDKAVPTAANAQLISGYTQAFAATGEANYLRVAIRAARHLLDDRRQPAGWFADQADVPHGAKPWLETQALVGLALLDLYQSSNDLQWLDAANALATYVGGRVIESDVRAGAGAGAGAVAAAGFLHRFSRFSNDPSLVERAGELLREVIDQPLPLEDVARLARLGVVLEAYAAGYVEMVISGEHGTPVSRQLYAAALAVYQPGKLVLSDRSGRFPSSAEPRLNVCTLAGCLSPISDPAELPVVLSSLGAAFEAR